MSATTERMSRELALPLAWDLLQQLGDSCERLEIVGSLRRLTPDCGDIELLAIPKWADLPGTDLFGNPIIEPAASLLEHQVYAMLADGVLQLRKPVRNGERYKALIFDGFPLDLFICHPPAQYGVLKVIRTGPAEYSKRLVTPVEKGGWMPYGMCCQDGSLWALGRGSPVRIETPEESDVFAAIGRRVDPPDWRWG